MKKLAIAILFLGIGISSEAGSWYVSKSGNNTDGKTWTTAWNEMNQIKWSSVQIGDTIWVAGGTYSTALTFGKSGTSSASSVTVW